MAATKCWRCSTRRLRHAPGFCSTAPCSGAQHHAIQKSIADVDASALAQRQAHRYNTHYLDEAAHVRDNLQFSYRNGNTTLLDYLSALRDYRAIHLSSLNANAQVWLAIHQLSYATATDIIP